MPILKHRLELQGISHVVSLVSFSDVKAFEENNFTGFTPKRRLNLEGRALPPRLVGWGVKPIPRFVQNSYVIYAVKSLYGSVWKSGYIYKKL